MIDSSQFYEYPSVLLTPNGHNTFTKDFDSIHMVLETSVIYYYGVDPVTCEPQITELTYSPKEKCYKITNGKSTPVTAFVKELEKESFYLKQNTL